MSDSQTPAAGLSRYYALAAPRRRRRFMVAEFSLATVIRRHDKKIRCRRDALFLLPQPFNAMIIRRILAAAMPPVKREFPRFGHANTFLDFRCYSRQQRPRADMHTRARF